MALHWNWSHGRVNRGQIERVGRRFARLPGHLFRIVVAHHPFMPPAEAAGFASSAAPEKPSLPSRNSASISSCRAISTAAIGGRSPKKRRCCPAGSVRRRGPARRPRGPATSTRLRDEPNSYNIISVADRVFRIGVRQWDGGGWVDRDPGSSGSRRTGRRALLCPISV